MSNERPQSLRELHLPSVLLVEDDASFAGDLMSKASGRLQIEWVTSAEEALERARSVRHDLILLDLYLREGRMNGFEFLEEMGRTGARVPIMLLTQEERAERIREAMHRGAVEYASKMLPIAETMDRMDGCIEKYRMSLRVRDLEAELRQERPFVFYDHPLLRALEKEVDRAAGVDSTVLLSGESGTGKSVLAMEIHSRSRRRTGPFQVFDCGGVQKDLIASELFGSVRGGYTGAVDREGIVERAHRGTLFIDEMDKLELVDQAKFQRLVEEREMRRIGGTAATRVDVRFIAASSIDLRSAAAEGRFRGELLNRLEVLSIRLPALRELREVIPEYALFQIERLCVAMHRPPLGLSLEAAAILQRSEWPGNVRDLRNVIESAVIHCDGGEILPWHLPDRLIGSAPVREEGGPMSPWEEAKQAADEIWRRRISELLCESGDSVSRAAESIGITPQGLRQKMAQLGIRHGNAGGQ